MKRRLKTIYKNLCRCGAAEWTVYVSYQLIRCVKENLPLRNSFFELANRVFGLSFQEWCESGYWTDLYLPYAICEGGRVVSNVSVNIMEFSWNGAPRRYIQLGTVMTAPEYRGKGLSRRLMEAVLEDWKNRCDALYLFANNTALDFYPKFGFERAEEYKACAAITPKGGKYRKMNLSDAADLALLKKYYQKSNPYSALAFQNNFGLLMFYCSSFLKDCIYFAEEADAVVIAEQTGGTLLCYDIYGGRTGSVLEILETVAGEEITKAVLGFTPKAPEGFQFEKVCAADDALFLLKGKENILCKNRLMFPLLSHA